MPFLIPIGIALGVTGGGVAAGVAGGLAVLSVGATVASTVTSIVAATREPPKPPSITPPNILDAQRLRSQAKRKERQRFGRTETTQLALLSASTLLDTDANQDPLGGGTP